MTSADSTGSVAGRNRAEHEANYYRQHSAPIRLRRGCPSVAALLLDALKRAAHRGGDIDALPARAPDLWCADLFLSGDDGLRWIATDVKSNPRTITPRRELPRTRAIAVIMCGRVIEAIRA